MCPEAVGFIEFGGGTTGRIERPGDLFEVADEFATARVDEEAAVAQSVLKAAINAIDTVANMRVDVSRADGRDIDAAPGVEEFTNKSPIGGGGGATSLVAAGIAIDLDFDRTALTEGLGGWSIASQIWLVLASGWRMISSRTCTSSPWRCMRREDMGSTLKSMAQTRGSVDK
jgi:hypothetical protein